MWSAAFDDPNKRQRVDSTPPYIGYAPTPSRQPVMPVMGTPLPPSPWIATPTFAPTFMPTTPMPIITPSPMVYHQLPTPGQFSMAMLPPTTPMPTPSSASIFGMTPFGIWCHLCSEPGNACPVGISLRSINNHLENLHPGLALIDRKAAEDMASACDELLVTRPLEDFLVGSSTTGYACSDCRYCTRRQDFMSHFRRKKLTCDEDLALESTPLSVSVCNRTVSTLFFVNKAEALKADREAAVPDPICLPVGEPETVDMEKVREAIRPYVRTDEKVDPKVVHCRT